MHGFEDSGLIEDDGGPLGALAVSCIRSTSNGLTAFGGAALQSQVGFRNCHAEAPTGKQKLRVAMVCPSLLSNSQGEQSAVKNGEQDGALRFTTTEPS